MPTVDLANLPSAGTDPGLRAEPILRESLVIASAAVPSGRAARGQQAGEVMALAALRDEPLVMFRAGYDLREVTLRACREAGFEPGFAVEGGEMDAVLSFVEAGLGIALVPSMVVVGRPGLRATALEPPGISRTIALAHRRDVTLTHAARALRGDLHAYLAEAVARSRALLTPGQAATCWKHGSAGRETRVCRELTLGQAATCRKQAGHSLAWWKSGQ